MIGTATDMHKAAYTTEPGWPLFYETILCVKLTSVALANITNLNLLLALFWLPHKLSMMVYPLVHERA